MNDPRPIYLHYHMRLQAPAVISTPSSNPDSTTTQTFVPGSAIRGVIAAQFAHSGAASAPLFQDVVLSGKVRYLNAYPEIDGSRSVPVPISWRFEKGDEQHVYDLSAFTEELPDGEPDWPAEQVAPIGRVFAAAVSRVGWPLAVPIVRGRLRQQRDRVRGTSWTDDQDQAHGTIFGFTQLDAEQTFRGVVQIMPEGANLATEVMKLLSRPALIGRARRAGYGGDAVLKFDDHPHDHEWFPQISRRVGSDVQAGETFQALLTSPYIGRSRETGQIDPLCLDDDLCDVLPVAIAGRCWDFEIAGGFNKKWRLETPQARSVSAGSVVVLRAEKHITLRQLLNVEDAGLGERRIDGFGRLAFVIPLGKDQFSVALMALPTEKGPLPGEHDEALRSCEKRLLLDKAGGEIAYLASFLAGGTPPEGIPSSSLLRRIQSIFRGVTDSQSAISALGVLATFVDGTSLKEAAKRQLEECQLSGGDRLLRWLRNVVMESTTPWQRLLSAGGNSPELGALAAKHYLSSPQSAQDILNESAPLLTAALIDNLLASLGRKRRAGT